MKFYMPVRLMFGAEKLPEALDGLGKSCLIACSPRAAKSCGALDDSLAALAAMGVKRTLFDSVSPNPRIETCMDAGRIAFDAGADFILGIGGGSAMDAAKAIAVFAANPKLDEDSFYKRQWTNEPKPIALIGTTAGTGSEVTMVSVLTDSIGRKHSIHDERLYARVALSDTRYLSAMPKALAISTGIDALSHCLESFFSKKADALSRAQAMQGAALLLKPLKSALAGTLTPEEIKTLYAGSILGGLAINSTGTCFPHNLGYFLTERFALAHGTASAAFLEGLLEFEAEVNPDLSLELYKRIGTEKEQLIHLIRSALDLNGIRLDMQELERILPRWENNSSVKNTLGDIGQDRIRQCFMKFVLEG